MVDLHLHSTASDGLLSPSELLSRVPDGEKSVLSLTDHDTIDGLEEFRNAGFAAGVQIINGVELSLDFEAGELHLLGLGIDPAHPGLADLLLRIRSAREKRNIRIFEGMELQGINADYTVWRAGLSTPSPGRPHIADYLIELGIVKSRREAFARYLSEGRPLFLPRTNPSLEEGIAEITASGGMPVVAHPLSLRISTGRMIDLLPRWKEMGIRAIETVHPSANRQQALRLTARVTEAGLLCSGGSDFHGTGEDRRFFGKTAWGERIPATLSILPLLLESPGRQKI